MTFLVRAMSIGCFAALAACTGNIGGLVGGSAGGAGEGDGSYGREGGSGGPAGTCGVDIVPGPSPIRRMNRAEYNHTVRDLLSDPSEPARGFVAEEMALGFNNNALALGVTELLANQYIEASEKLAATAIAKLPKILPCDASKDDRGCAATFVRVFGKRAFRRPLATEETDRLMKVYDGARKGGSHASALKLVLQAILQSPHFLYRVEFGQKAAPGARVTPLTHYEIASRLSYFLWESMPDDALFAAAEAGKLGTAEEVAAQARRMVKDPRTRATVADFHAQWLGLWRMESTNKDTKAFPEWTPQLRKDLRKETETFVDDVFWSTGSVEALLTAPYSFMSGSLAKHYGERKPTGDLFVRVDLDPTQRAGILTQGSTMALHAKPKQSSPVHRGRFVREQLLCQVLPPPPPEFVIFPPDPDPKSSTRQRFIEHRKNPACAGCHKLMDPIGFGFENYDTLGRWRTKDGPDTVDASGEVVETKDTNGTFVGATELARKLGQSTQVRGCMVTQWFRFAYGRGETDEDKCTLAFLQSKFAASGYDMRELLVAITQSDAFRFRKPVVAGGGS